MDGAPKMSRSAAERMKARKANKSKNVDSSADEASASEDESNKQLSADNKFRLNSEKRRETQRKRREALSQSQEENDGVEISRSQIGRQGPLSPLKKSISKIPRDTDAEEDEDESGDEQNNSSDELIVEAKSDNGSDGMDDESRQLVTIDLPLHMFSLVLLPLSVDMENKIQPVLYSRKSAFSAPWDNCVLCVSPCVAFCNRCGTSMSEMCPMCAAGLNTCIAPVNSCIASTTNCLSQLGVPSWVLNPPCCALSCPSFACDCDISSYFAMCSCEGCNMEEICAPCMSLASIDCGAVCTGCVPSCPCLHDPSLWPTIPTCPTWITDCTWLYDIIVGCAQGFSDACCCCFANATLGRRY